MPLYKNWNDYDTLRDKNKVLVIYGAGYMGLKLLNDYEVIPNFFCDKNANQIKNIRFDRRWIIPCLTLKQLLTELNGRDADILISNMDGKIIKDLHKIFDKIKFTENTVIYFHNDYNIVNSDFVSRNPFYKINGMTNRVLDFSADFYYIRDNFDIEVILKNAYFNDHISSINEFETFIKNRKFIIQFLKGRILHKIVQSNTQSKPVNLLCNKMVYFFCDSRFINSFCKYDYGIESILSSLLNNTNYKIENYSFCGANDCQIIFQLTNVPLVQNSIVIVDNIYNSSLLAVAKLYCEKYNCRLLFYHIPLIYSRNKITDYEKWFINQATRRGNELNFYYEKRMKKIKLTAKAMGIEFYEPPDIFFNLDKTIFLDAYHFGDYGNEIIAKHLCDIITSQPVNSNNNDCEDFHIEPEEKIEYANSVIPLLVPDIPIYLNDLKKHKQNVENCGAIVMNCNPFTLGHRYLIEYAANKTERLYIFVVEEDKSEFSFKDRYKLVKQNTKDLKNVTVLPSGEFIISSKTFDAYFGKSLISEEQTIEDVSFDLLIFAAAIVPTLNIKTRFVGQEPFDPLTRHYNEEMKKLLPEYGCDVVEIPRLEKNGGAVSASRVRKFLKDGNFEEIRKIVPEATFRYLSEFL